MWKYLKEGTRCYMEVGSQRSEVGRYRVEALEQKSEDECEYKDFGKLMSEEVRLPTSDIGPQLAEIIAKYEKVMQDLKKALNTNAWDGRWYKRAYMDDGNVLGSIENEECRIDGISQSWSVISNAGDNDKKYISMESMENHLVDRENMIIKLLDPPFDKSKLEPGYIKAYLPGVRENGGQYTHRSCLGNNCRGNIRIWRQSSRVF